MLPEMDGVLKESEERSPEEPGKAKGGGELKGSEGLGEDCGMEKGLRGMDEWLKEEGAEEAEEEGAEGVKEEGPEGVKEEGADELKGPEGSKDDGIEGTDGVNDDCEGADGLKGPDGENEEGPDGENEEGPEGENEEGPEGENEEGPEGSKDDAGPDGLNDGIDEGVNEGTDANDDGAFPGPELLVESGAGVKLEDGAMGDAMDCVRGGTGWLFSRLFAI